MVIAISCFAQDSTAIRQNQKEARKSEKREKINSMVKQEEEGILSYRKQSIFAFELRTNGYGAMYEVGKMKTVRRTNIYFAEFNEIKDPKEQKLPQGGTFFGNPYIYGKKNYFYPFKLGYGQQLMLGQKGNKNGVAVIATYSGGLSLGLLRPYYLDVENPNTGVRKTIKYDDDSTTFVTGNIYGGAGLAKGWNEIKVKPGAFIKSTLRFDWGRFNEMVSGIEVGASLEFYSEKIPIELYQKEKQLFFQAHVALLLGRRK